MKINYSWPRTANNFLLPWYRIPFTIIGTSIFLVGVIISMIGLLLVGGKNLALAFWKEATSF